MSTKEVHLNFIAQNGSFKLNYNNTIFNIEEFQILEKYGHWFKALTEEVLEPFTDAQIRFIEVMEKKEPPITIYEKTWYRYINRFALESKLDLTLNYTVEKDSFYSREDAKQNKRVMFGVNSSIHKG